MYSNPSKCGAQGTLSDTDAMRLQNLAFTLSIMTWDHRELTCSLPVGHLGAHIQHLADQSFTQPVQWWASWYDEEGLKDQAAMFTAPSCSELLHEPGMEPGDGEPCLLPDGHVGATNGQHMFFGC
jgi:hypothetical protein